MEGMCNESDFQKKLSDAAAAFTELLQQHALLLANLSFASSHKNALHIAVEQGNHETVSNILRENPQPAEELDSLKSSPLHIAAAKGHAEIAAELLLEAPNMCWSRDYRGMNPVHVAAMNGHVGVLEKLVERCPYAALEKLDRGENALHLCVKHHRLQCLKVLVKTLGEYIHAVDNDGETVLHWAVRYQHVGIVEYLTTQTKIDQKSRKSAGQMALKLVSQGDSSSAKIINKILKSSIIKELLYPPREQLMSKRELIMVVAVLIATMAFQAAVSPPGGVWQDDTPPHRAGESVMAFTHPNTYKIFMRLNTVAFVSSLSTILLLISELLLRYQIFMWISMFLLLLSVMTVGFTYAAALMVVTPENQRRSLSHVVQMGILAWSCLVVFLFFVTTLRWLHFMWRNLKLPFTNKTLSGSV